MGGFAGDGGSGDFRYSQEDILRDIEKDTGLVLRSSDAFLLAHLSAEDAKRLDAERQASLDRFQRGSGYRFCLTPYFVARDPEVGTRSANRTVQL